MDRSTISKIGLGGYELGDDPAWPGARDVLVAAAEAGITWIDTAEAYSDYANETVIGAAIADTGTGSRFAISSKVAPNYSGFRPEEIRRACEGSLERLGRDRLDLYFMHYPGGDVPLEDSWAAMRALVDDGLVENVGLSNYDQPDIERALAVGPVDVVQECLSPIDRLQNRRLFRWCADRSIAVVTYEPLANGMLAGAISAPEDFARVVGDDYAEWGFWKRLFSPGRFERSAAVANGMKAIAREVGCSLAQLALAWNVHQTGVSSTLAGSRNPVHVRENGAAGAIELDREKLDAIDALVQLGPTFA